MHCCVDGIGIFETGVTRKFAQIFFREDKDLTGKRTEDPKNAYVTSIFGAALISKYFRPHLAGSNDFTLEIPRDSNMLGRVAR